MKSKFFEDMNMFAIGVFIGVCVATAFGVNIHKGAHKKETEAIKAYEQYYEKTETLLDSLDTNRELDLDDTDLCSDYGADYLKAKDKVDSIAFFNGYRK